MRSEVWAVFAVLFLTASLGYAAEVHEEEVKRFPIPPGSRLSVRMQDGTVRVSTWKRSEAEIAITKRAWGRGRKRAEERLAEIEVAVRKHRAGLEVVVYDHGRKTEFSFWDLFDPDTWSSEGRRAEVDLRITVPEQTSFMLNGDDCDVQIRGLNGGLDLEFDDGGVEIQKIRSDDIRIETGDADIDLYDIDSADGRIWLMSDDGRIRVEKCEARELEAETDDGDVVLISTRLQRLSVRTEDGDVDLEPDLEDRARVRVVTDDGDVVLSLPEDIDCQFDLETEEGEIRSDFDLEIEETEYGARVRDKIGSGRIRISVYSQGGDVRLESR